MARRTGRTGTLAVLTMCAGRGRLGFDGSAGIAAGASGLQRGTDGPPVDHGEQPRASPCTVGAVER